VKIAKVRARVLSSNLGDTFSFSIAGFSTYSCVLVEVESDDGLVGYGEAIVRRAPEMARAAVESLLAPVVIGEDPRRIGHHWVAMINRLRRWGHSTGVVMEAVSGVDTALWDLVGRHEGKPIWELLYGKGRRQLPCYASALAMADDETVRTQALEQVAGGFTALKMKIGRRREQGGMRADVRAVAAVRDAVGPEVDLYVDANGAYDAASAIRVARGLEDCDVGFFEEPVPPDDLAGYERVRAATSVPLAAGETAFSPFGFRELIERRLVDIVQPDVGRCGGITGAWQATTLTYAANLALAPHTGLSGGVSQLAALHIGAASPTLDPIEYMVVSNPLREIFVGGYPVAHDGLVDVPAGPGLGLELDRDALDELTAR
jgi:D-galactarolactone cycloisomerase